jgi:hypothetical protein
VAIDPIDLTVPEIRHLLGTLLNPPPPMQAAALVKPAQTPPGHGPQQPLPAATHQPLNRTFRSYS